jgi:hypothetical protein
MYDFAPASEFRTDNTRLDGRAFDPPSPGSKVGSHAKLHATPTPIDNTQQIQYEWS